MTNYNLIFYATHALYNNKRFKFRLNASGWLLSATNILDKFYDNGNDFKAAFITIDHINKIGQVIETQRIKIPVESYIKKQSS